MLLDLTAYNHRLSRMLKMRIKKICRNSSTLDFDFGYCKHVNSEGEFLYHWPHQYLIHTFSLPLPVCLCLVCFDPTPESSVILPFFCQLKALHLDLIRSTMNHRLFLTTLGEFNDQWNVEESTVHTNPKS